MSNTSCRRWRLPLPETRFAFFHLSGIELWGTHATIAAGLEREGFAFDAGPYLLLDRPGLEWAFREVGLDLGTRVPMRARSAAVTTTLGFIAPLKRARSRPLWMCVASGVRTRMACDVFAGHPGRSAARKSEA